MDMGPVQYDDYFRAPWATSIHLEEKHKQICLEIGTSLKGDILDNYEPKTNFNANNF